MDMSTNLPVKIDVFEVRDVTNALYADEISIKLKYSYPDSFKMDDLSPTSYDKLANRILLDEDAALNLNT
jgi:hypothetical protein